MAVNKVAFGQNVLIDLTSDTVEPSYLKSGITAHDKSGRTVTGSMVVQTFHAGTSEPAASLGNNGDLYLMLEG